MATNLSSDIDLDDIKLQFDEYGYVILPNLIPRDDALAMAEKLMELTMSEGDSGKGDAYQSLPCLFNHLKAEEYDQFLPLISNPIILELVRHSVGEGYQLIGSNVVWRRPGVTASAVHADVPTAWFIEQGLPIPRNICFLVQVNWMLTDFIKDNGATRILPISHLLDPPNKSRDSDGNDLYLNDRVRRLRKEIEEGDPMGRMLAAEGKAGSAVVFHGYMWHQAAANVTEDEHRVGVLVPYHTKLADPAYGLGLPDSLMNRRVRDRMPEDVRRMSMHVVEDYPEHVLKNPDNWIKGKIE